MLLFADGFEHYGSVVANMIAGYWSAFETVSGASTTLSTAQARTGSRSLLTANGGVNTGLVGPRFAFGATAITCGLGIAAYLAALPASNALCGIQFRDNTNTPILTICFQSDGSLCARKGGPAGAVIDISDAILTAGTFNHIETKATFDTVAGYVEIRVNGVTKLQIGSLNLGAAGAAQAFFGLFTAGAPNIYWDDIFVWDDTGAYNNDFMGPQRMLMMFPTGDTAQADFTLVGSGTGYGAVDEIPQDGDTSYLYSNTVNDKSDFSLPTLPPELVEIVGVVVLPMAKLDAAGIGNLKMSLVSGTDVLAGSDVPLTTDYSYYRNVFEYDPATSAPWTKAGLEAALLRVEKSL